MTNKPEPRAQEATPHSDISRRDALKLISLSTATFFLQACVSPGKQSPERKLVQGPDREWLKVTSPVNRLGVSPGTFSGDNPTRQHSVLWSLPASAQPESGTIETAEVVVIGGGMSGLASAYLLRDFNPIILEQADRFGGNSKAESWNGIDYSIGAAYFNPPKKGSPLEQLYYELGLVEGAFLRRADEKAHPVVLNRKITYDFWDGPTTKKNKNFFRRYTQLLAEFQMQDDGGMYPEIPAPNPQVRAATDRLDQESLKQFLERNLGKLPAPFETAIEHYCWSSFGASMSELSAAAGLNFLAAETTGVLVAPGGNAGVAERILERINTHVPAANLRTSSLVTRIQHEENSVLVTYHDSENKPHQIRAKAVVAAIPKFIAARLISNLEPERKAAIARMKYRSYLVCNVLLNQSPQAEFFDCFLLDDGLLARGDVRARAAKSGATDVILANFAHSTAHSESGKSVLSFYRALPYDGARGELLAEDAYQKYLRDFQAQITEILPIFKIKAEDIVELRLARWGHPMPVAETGLMRTGVFDTIRTPFGAGYSTKRVYFIEQDNWALPAIETSLSEALHFAPQLRSLLRS